MDGDWDDLRAVLHVVQGQSLAAAAQRLGVNYTTVARRIARAEAALDQILFERLADGYKPTDTGLLVAEKAARMEEAHDAMLRGLTGRDARLSGPLTITAPQLLIAHFLAPALDRFSAAHSDVRLHLRATNELLNLTRREADLAIRISDSPGDSLKGVRLARQDNASFASPDWAQRIAQAPDDPIDWLVYDRLGDVPKDAKTAYPSSRVRMRFDDMMAMAGAAQEGLGVVRMPMFLGRALPGLVQVPVLPPRPYFDIWMVAHPDVWPSAKLAAFRRVVAGEFKARRAVFAGAP